MTGDEAREEVVGERSDVLGALARGGNAIGHHVRA